MTLGLTAPTCILANGELIVFGWIRLDRGRKVKGNATEWGLYQSFSSGDK